MQKINSKINNLVTILIVVIFLINIPAIIITQYPMNNSILSGVSQTQSNQSNQFIPKLIKSIKQNDGSTINDWRQPGVGQKVFPSDINLDYILSDNNLDYQKVWEPWVTKAAVRCVVTDPSNEWLAVGGGYLYDNEVHIYRWNQIKLEYEKVWDSGDELITGDVLSIDFGDTDNNDLLEIVVGSADGHIYVFEQEHIYDPYDNLENQFVNVWTSPKLQQVWGVKVADIDKDYLPDIIAGAWDGKVHIFEYTKHSGYPFTQSHWIEYDEKTTLDIGQKVFSIAIADTNFNALPEILIGTQNGRIFIYENDGTVLYVNGKPWPLTNDNSYRYTWDSGNITWKPITKIAVGNLDTDENDEIAYLSQGQGVYAIDYNEDLKRYLTYNLWYPLESWETPTSGHYLNQYIDSMISSNNNEGDHVYYRFPNNTIILEPISRMNPAIASLPCFPKNAHLALEPDHEYTIFDASTGVASAIIDFGNDGEIMGDGLVGVPEESLGYELEIFTHPKTVPDIYNLKIGVSPDNSLWSTISLDQMIVRRNTGSNEPYKLLIDIDKVLADHKWPFIRYLNFTLLEGKLKIDSIYSSTLFRPIDTASSLIISNIDEDYAIVDVNSTYLGEPKKIIIGTVDGKLLGFKYDSVCKNYRFFWNSYTNDSYTQGTQIWDITEVRNPGKIPTWLYNSLESPIMDLSQQLDPYLDGNITSMDRSPLFKTFFDTIITIDPEYEVLKDMITIDVPENDLVISTDNGKLFYFPELLHKKSINISGSFFWQINNGTYKGKLISAHLADIWREPYKTWFKPEQQKENNRFNLLGPLDEYRRFERAGIPETLFLGVVSPGNYYNLTSFHYSDAEIMVYEFTPPKGNLATGYFEKSYSLTDRETSGRLKMALYKSLCLPKVSSGDVDKDGDMDLIMTNGRLYLIENINNSFYNLNPDYFAEINLQATDYLFNNPQLSDFDGDGDLDLTVGFANRAGATYYENIGSVQIPIWKERKWLYTNSNGGLLHNNLTFPIFTIKDGMITGLFCYNNYSNRIYQLRADYTTHNAFVIGTNPIISRVEINLRSGTSTAGAKLENYGYHIFETWNTKLDLEQWTHKITVGDLDQDGKQEIIVGDYDNNIYVFENLVNNTYKRAYRSKDLTHYEYSTVSPYAYEQLGGISGQFRRRIWDHVDDLIAGVDLDNDGYLEMIAIAGLSIYVWEQKQIYSVGINDEYQLVWLADFRESVWKSIFDQWGVFRFTSLTYGGDLDYNGLGEFVVAADSFLFVFEATSGNNFRENFLVNPYPVRGRYQLPGNPFSNLNVRTLKINTIIVGDTDNDRLNEIIIGGYNETWYNQYNGFIMILENKIGTYEYSWCASSLYMTENPVYDLLIDDQDYDGFKEIIAGTYKGVIIYENIESSTGENKYQQVSYLSSFVNYPAPRLNQFFDTDFKYAEGLSSADTIELIHGTDTFSAGTWLQVFQIDQHLYYSFSTDRGTTWSFNRPVIDKYNFTYVISGQTYYWKKSFMESQPSLIETNNGKIWLAFIGWFSLKYGSTEIQKAGIWLLELKDIGGKIYWSNNHLSDTHLIVEITNPRVLGLTYQNPSLFEYPSNTENGLAVSYISYSKHIYWKDTSAGETAPYTGQIPNIGLDAENDEYLPFTHDSIRLYNGEYLFIFSGRRYKDMKLDVDIWAIKANESMSFEDYPFIRITTTSSFDLLPAITQTVDTRTIMVIFKAEGFDPTGKLAITYSKDNGLKWRQPESVSIVPPFARWVSYPDKGISLLVRKDNPSILVKSYQISNPIIFKGHEGGFSYSFLGDYSFIDVNSLGSETISAFSLVGGYSVAEVSGVFDSTSGFSSYSGQISIGQTTPHSGISQIIGGTFTMTGGRVMFNDQQIGLTYNLTGGSGGGLYSSSSSIAIGSTRRNAVGASTPSVIQSQQNNQPVNQNPVIIDTQTIVTTTETNIMDNTRVSITNDDITGSSDGTDSQSTEASAKYGTQLTNSLPSTPACTSGVMESYLSGDEEESDVMIMTGVISGSESISSIYSGQTGGTAYNAGLGTSTGFVAVVPSFNPPEDHGHRKNIFYGTNPSSDFSRYDFTSAYAIASGDTDNDYRKEIAIASDYNVYLVELSSTSNISINYRQIWTSEILESQPTDVELFDSNSNGWQEIIFSCTDGNVYSFEGSNLNLPKSNPLFLDETPIWSNQEFDLYYGSNNDKLQSIIAITSYNNDDVDDLFYTSFDLSNPSVLPTLSLVDGTTGSIVWSKDIGYSDTMVVIIKAADLNNDSIDDAVCAFTSLGSDFIGIQAYNGLNGDFLWPMVTIYNTGSHEFVDLDLIDLNTDNIKDILLATEHKISVIDGFRGSLETPLLNYELKPTVFVNKVDTLDETILVVITNPSFSNTSVMTYTDNNFIPIPTGSSFSKDFSDYSSIVSAKIIHKNNLDDLGIIIAINKTLYALDIDTKDIIWSTVLKDTISNNNILSVNLNGDECDDIIVITSYIEAFNGKNGQRLWNKYQMGEVKVSKVELTNFDQDAFVDDLIMTIDFSNNDSAIAVIDCSNIGTLLLFKYYQNTSIYDFATGNLFNQFSEELIIATDMFNMSLTCWTTIREDATLNHKIAVVSQPQMIFQSRGAINDIAIIDANNDGINDLVYCDSRNYLMAIDGSNEDIIWKYRLPFAVISFEESDVNLDGIKDILCLDSQGNMILINGEIGRKIWEDTLSKNLYYVDYSLDMIVNQMTASDLNGDGKDFELIIATGFKSSFSIGALIVYNMSSREVIWTDVQFSSPYYKFILADSNNDGQLDIITGAYGSYIKIYDGSDGSEIFKYPVAVQDFVVGDFSTFTYPDIAIIQRNGSVFVLTTVNGWVSNSKLWEKNLNPKFRLSHLAKGQFNSEPQEDLVIKSYGEASITVDGNSGDIIWIFNDTSLFYTEIYLVLDINNDTLDDIITLNYNTIYAISGNSSYETSNRTITNPNVCWASFVANDTVISVNSGDLNGDGIPDVIIGTLNGYLIVLNGGNEESLVQKSTNIDTVSIEPTIEGLLIENSVESQKYSLLIILSEKIAIFLLVPVFIWSLDIVLATIISHSNKKVLL